jgi:hypothetical protein
MEWNETAALKQCISTKTHISNTTLFTHLNPPQFCGSEVQINEIKSIKIKVCYSKYGKNKIFLGMPTLTLHSSNTYSRIQLAHVAQCTEIEGVWKKTFS